MKKLNNTFFSISGLMFLWMMGAVGPWYDVDSAFNWMEYSVHQWMMNKEDDWVILDYELADYVSSDNKIQSVIAYQKTGEEGFWIDIETIYGQGPGVGLGTSSDEEGVQFNPNGGVDWIGDNMVRCCCWDEGQRQYIHINVDYQFDWRRNFTNSRVVGEECREPAHW